MLTVITGGMFAEKSTELLRRGRRLKRAGKKVGYFKPAFDSRYSEHEIVTHDGAKVEAFIIKTNAPIQITSREYFNNFDVFLIDEVQFFDSTITLAVQTLLEAGKEVIVAGLDMDYKAQPFFVTAGLMSIAEDVVKLKAVCAECKSDAWVSFKAENGKRLQLGTNEYTPLCRKCFNIRRRAIEDEVF
ncbi:thymidine kinase [Bacillus altitudinis]|uniref:thymidine kinase n=1 Tax=Bacillus altitudinis TaxID=293387 RepID=UPI002100EC4D|nr:thymidine kinase [Bacillus altitudinis]UTV34903.1 thymidine kinase [Bacillus altitudinis]